MKNYCRCDAPDGNGRRSECGLPGVQCKSCKDKDTIDALVDALGDVIDGYSCYDLADFIGSQSCEKTLERAQEIIDIYQRAKS